MICCLFSVICRLALAEELENAPTEKPVAATTEKPDRYFDMKVPEGFKLEPAEEPGIFKWKKDSAEIHAIIGDAFTESADELFQALRKGAEANKKMGEVKTLRIKGGYGLLYKEKNPEESGRLRSWRLVVLTNKKMINVDFTAPSQDFNALAPGFESAVKSFKLKSSS
jgi:hypothetical protein